MRKDEGYKMKINLPQSAESHDQERRSFLKFQLILPKEKFLFRTESGGDYGIDCILELKIEKSFVTNLRSHVQLKSVAEANRNKDGSFSFPIPVSTLNYLMNQPNSIFSVYLENEDVFLWDWVVNIYKFAKSQNVDIQDTNQEKISYRFTQIFNDRAFNEIHSHVVSSGNTLRKINEITIPLSKSEDFKSAILLKGNQVTDLGKLSEQLKKAGISLVNTGQAGLVNELLGKLPAESKNDIDLALIGAYAKLNTGEVLDALSWLPKGRLRQVLSGDNKIFAEILDISINYSLRLINFEQYLNELSNIENQYPNSILTLQIKLERLRQSALAKRLDDSANLVSEINSTAHKLKTHSQADESLKIMAETITWELEGYQFNSKFMHSVIKYNIRDISGTPFPIDDRIKDASLLIAKFERWVNIYKELRKKLSENPIAFAKLIITYATVKIQFIAFSRTFTSEIGEDSDDDNHLRIIFNELSKVVDFIKSTGDYQVGLHAMLLQADALEGLNRKDDAMKIVTQVKNIAEQIGFTKMVNTAENYLAGESIWGTIRNIKESIPDTNEEIARSLTEEDIKDFAETMLNDLGLPQDRLTYIEKDLRWSSQDAKDAVSFCKYYKSYQHLAHTSSPDTLYKTDPLRKIVCLLLGYESPKPGIERDELVSEFKRLYCNTCTKREI